jgi:hypothetical protein
VRRFTLIAALAIIGPVAVGSTAQAGSCASHCHHIYINEGTHQAVEPSRLFSLSGDGAFYVTKLRHWHHWDHPAATARGKAHLNDCDPSCVSGHFHTYRARVRVSEPVHCSAHRSYSNVRVRFHHRTVRQHWPHEFACS